MITYKGIDRNFQFMVLEVRKQLESTFRLLQEPSEDLQRTILSRDNYIDTLKSLIEKKCINYFRHHSTLDKFSANLATAIQTVTVNLERMADFCVNIATQVQKISDAAFLGRFRFEGYFRELLAAMDLVGPALGRCDTPLALQICRTEAVLNKLYQADFQAIRDQLRAGRDTDNLISTLYIAHYLERVGDALLNVGEAILFAATGEKLKLHEYTRLQEALSQARPETSIADCSIEFNWETRSGSRIAKVGDKTDTGHDPGMVFKKGRADKLARERQNIQRWHELRPGLAPTVLGFQGSGEDAGLLLEFLDGYTIRDLVLNGDEAVLDAALTGLEDVLSQVWTGTRRREPVCADFAGQAAQRMEDVLRLHPEFANDACEAGSRSAESLERLLRRAREVEPSVQAPFKVFIHGDFNADNIIFNHRTRKIHFIDLHRSAESDYVQDVSVFLVSNFRLTIMEGHIRALLNQVNVRFHRFACRFASRSEDTTYFARLALGLARSFITSTRFEVDREFARVMYQRALDLLRRIVDHPPRPWAELRMSEEVIEY